MLNAQGIIGIDDVILVHGMYQFAPRRLAFRNDFCLACRATRIAVQVRSFYVAHVYWIPVLPLGRWKAWVCSVCGRDPHEPVQTRRLFKVLLAIIVALMAVPLWFATPGADEATIIRVMRLVTLVAFCGALWWATRGHRAAPSLRSRLATVLPYEARTCPFCGGSLFDNPRWHCPACSLERSEINAGG